MDPTPTPSSPPHSPQPTKKLKMSSTTSTTSDDEADPSIAAATAAAATAAAAAPSDPKPRRPKRRKIAIFLAYCGAGYQGMQKNPGARTIEGDLEEALFLAGGVPDSDRNCPKRYDWARSARTDKGVSAAGQVVSGRFYIDPPGFVERLNSHLPDQIRIFGLKRVTASFNAKKFCDRRRYVYLLPVFALDPEAHPDRESVMASLGSGNELSKCLECSERGRKVEGIMGRQSRINGKEEKSELGVQNGGAALNSGNVVETIVLVEKEKTELEGNGIVGASLNPGNVIETRVSLEVGKAEDKKGAGNGESEAVGNVSCVVIADAPLAVESDFSVVEESTKLDREEVVIEKKSVVEADVEMDEGKAESGLVDGNDGENVAAQMRKFCYGDKEKERFNAILKRYVGTHNFHNFTTRIKAEDPSARRYIISFTADHVVNLDGIDFVRCEVVGQSFMLHQIRKMIGFAVAMMRNCIPESLMDTALRQDININVPTAPEVGLYLDECLFSSYNQKWKDSHEELSMEAYAEEVEEFKLKHIFSHIASMEHKEGAVALWLHSLNHRNYPDFHYNETNGKCTDTEQGPVENMAD